MGVAWGSLATSCLVGVIALRAYRLVGLGGRDLASAVAPAYVSSVIMYAAVTLLAVFLGAWQISHFTSLTLQVLAGVLVYIAGVGLLRRPLLRDALALAAGMMRRQATATPGSA